jgi:hypothetical protein
MQFTSSKVQKRRKADVIFLSETHLEEWSDECLSKRLKMDRKEVSISNGQSGGLVMYRKNQVDLSLRFKTDSFIDVDIGSGVESVWRLHEFMGNQSGRIKTTLGKE